ncbi:hypothetical protein [Photobacterium sp. OFAV2-7]|uniref:hypothetical protein n=1 Tax=Photobacterium sp. OFAV2-7 TaxID=2917748 RepID=UPI001EF5E290|nr:hypothetical protein [Photobacterium sp. OFAV2-7]MCG7586750.1 hypothetical protein [Photobacterium sp. OFAV2-7]
MNIENITGNETLEELEAMLDELDDAVLVDEPTEAEPVVDEAPEPKTDTDEASSEADTNAAPAAAEQEEPEQGEEKQEEQPQKYIAAKDGEHRIPYEVLEAERAQNQRLQEELAASKQREADFEKTERLLEVRDKQLQKLGVDPADLPENLKITDEQLDDLQENYPELAPVISTLIAKVQAQAPAQEEQPAPDVDPVVAAISDNSDLSSWQEEQGDRWNVALHIDDTLLSDPAYQGKPASERLAEVVRRTKLAFGEVEQPPEPDTPSEAAEPEVPNESVTEKAKEVVEKAASQSLPNSPSDVGASNTHTGSLLEQAAGMDSGQLESLFDGMTPAQIDALLEQADSL